MHPSAALPRPATGRRTHGRAHGRAYAVLVLLTLLLLVSTACSDDGTTWWTKDDPRTGSGHDGDRDAVDNVVTGPVNGRDAVEFSLVSSATTISVTSVDLGDALYRFSTPEDSAFHPTVVDDGAHVQLHLKKRSDTGPESVKVELNSGVRWRLRFDAGVTTNRVDMTSGAVSGVDLAAGATRVELLLPKPSGTVPVRLGGGASELSVTVPAGVPAQVRVGNGAGTVAIDGQTTSGVPAGTNFPASGYGSTADRYDIDLATGVSTLRVDHR